MAYISRHAICTCPEITLDNAKDTHLYACLLRLHRYTDTHFMIYYFYCIHAALYSHCWGCAFSTALMLMDDIPKNQVPPCGYKTSIQFNVCIHLVSWHKRGCHKGFVHYSELLTAHAILLALCVCVKWHASMLRHHGRGRPPIHTATLKEYQLYKPN